jgi:pyruvate dehydrogenase E2 component (dihydrolipoamide acetyltransferase)
LPLVPSRVVPLTGLRRITAARMRESIAGTAQLTLHSEVDAGAMLVDRERRPERPSITAYVARALALALREHPRLNSRIVGEAVEEFDEVNLAVAVAVPDGLVAPVLRRAAEVRLLEAHQAIRDLAERARAKRLTLRDFEDATASLTNLGMYGVDGFTPILNAPQTAILGVGRIRDTVALDGGAVRPRSVLALSLTFDHQVADGAGAASLLATVARRLGTPAEL